jgi:CDP-glucose 4,6-dehydratase
MLSKEFWSGRKVFVTGHTGFKGAWLCLWLHALGAKVSGYALEPPTQPNLFELAGVESSIASQIGDVRDLSALQCAVSDAAPEVVIHMAAQSLVRQSYSNPLETYSVNVMGTVNLLESIRLTSSVRAVVNVTTDKCYENREWYWGYRENEPLGGYDPYSSSKGCSELVTAAYRSSFFNPNDYARHGVAVASARAGNVIGGGDWAADRLVPDCLSALLRREKITIRSPLAIRPWQHVLEPLGGYLLLAQRLCDSGPRFATAWNFGPADADSRPVEWIVQRICDHWGRDAAYVVDDREHPHEANYLKLDCSKARAELGWRPRWDLETTISRIVEWTLAYQEGRDLREVCLGQIADYEKVFRSKE